MSLETDTEVGPPKCPFSLKETENTVPFDLYGALRQEGEVLWDEAMNAWIVTSYDACREVFKNDKILFRHPDGDADSDYAAMAPGMRPTKALAAEPHRRVHNWLMAAFSPTETAAMQDKFVREVIAAMLARIEGRPRIDLVHDFIDNIPVRVVAAALDLPWQDAEWIGKVHGNLKVLGTFFAKRMAVTPELAAAAKAASQNFKDMMVPILEERRDGTGADLISKLWRDGPGLVDDWTINDTFSHVNSVFLGGTDTTTMGISNAFYILLKDRKLLERLRTAPLDLQQRYVEEALRLLPPSHYRARRASADTEIAGVKIRKDDFVIPVMGSANRDGEHYQCPAEIDFQRRNPRDHLTFITGPRSCIGSGLARIEIRETIRLFLDRYPDAELDRDAPEPAYVGLTNRRFEPIFVRLNG